MFTCIVAAQEGPGIVIAYPGQDVELLCTVTGIGAAQWRVNGTSYTFNELLMGQLAGPNITLNADNIIVEDIMMNDSRNGSMYVCFIPGARGAPDNNSDPTILLVAGECIINAKQKHLGCKKVRGQSEAACKQASAIKRYDIS